MNLLSVDDLSIGHSFSIIKNLNFKVNSGEVFIINGGNGAGKSTLVRTLVGEISQIAGNYKWNINNEKITYLSQSNSTYINSSYTMREILEFLKTDRDLFQYIDESILNKKWNTLSGGQRQKGLMLSRINNNTNVLILDEPFNQLDENSVIVITKLLEKLVLSGRILALLIISHQEVSFTDLTPKEVRL